MKNRTIASVLVTLTASTLLLPALVGQPASAARLVVTAAPIQFWDILDGLPEPPEEPETPGADLSECGDPEQYDEIVYGTPGNDVLEAGNGRQILVGQGGDDVLSGGNQDDCLLGGPGDDVLRGDNGKDILLGGLGADHLDGGNGKDKLIGGLGADRLDGGEGKDRLDAGGNPGDTCFTTGAPDELIGCGEDESLVADDATTPDLAAEEETTSDPVVEPAPGPKDKGDKPGNGHAPGKNTPAPGQSAGGAQSEPAPAATKAPSPDAGTDAAADETVPGE